MQKPFDATTHVGIDYGFIATLILAPTVFNLPKKAANICYSFGSIALAITALTDTKLAAKRIISINTHGKLDTPFVPTLLALPMVTGAMKNSKARNFFLSFFAAAATNYLLTDYTRKDS